jgi:kumamolisin
MKAAASAERKVELAGSLRAEPQDADAAGIVDPGERITVTVHVKRRTADKYAPGSAGDLARLAEPWTRATLARQRKRTHGRAVQRIVKFAKARRLKVCEVDVPGRRVVIEGSARRMSQIFGAALVNYVQQDGRRFRARTGRLMIPTEIAPWTRAILGFDQRPIARTYLRSASGAGSANALWPTDMAGLYGIPLDRDTPKECVGIIALGGGYLPADVAAAVAGMGRVAPTVIDQSVGGVVNSYGGGTFADQEIALDLQVLAGLLPRGRIVVYFAPNTTQGLSDALHQAVFDDQNRPSVLSLSWGSAEKFWTPIAQDAMQSALADAARLRVTVVVAAGDELASSGLSDAKAHVWFPASSPYVLGCGGSAVTLNGATLAAEDVWNEGSTGTGGGISDIFPVPAYQEHTVLPASVNDGAVRRGVPDIAAAAAGQPGYRIILNGQPVAKDGTSAATPLWAGLIAIANAERGSPIGLLNPSLYANPALCRVVTQGNNRINGTGYDAGPAWSACTGLGVPRGRAIVSALAAIPVA